MKKIKTLKTTLITILSSILVVAVFLISTHAKDLFGYHHSALRREQDMLTHRDVVAKSTGELHSHVDKTMVKDPGISKSMSKVFGDTSGLLARREREEQTEDQPISVKLIEMMFMARLTLAYALANK